MNEFVQHLKDRVTSPIFGPYIYFWMLINWRAIVYLFSGDDGAQKRIEAIASHLKENPNHWEGPLWLTIGYITVAKVAIHLYEYFPRWLATRKAAKDRIAAIDLATIDQYDKTYSEILVLTYGAIKSWSLNIENARVVNQKSDQNRTNDYLMTLKNEVEEHQKLFSKMEMDRRDFKKMKTLVESLGPRLKKYYLR